MWNLNNADSHFTSQYNEKMVQALLEICIFNMNACIDVFG